MVIPEEQLLVIYYTMDAQLVSLRDLITVFVPNKSLFYPRLCTIRRKKDFQQVLKLSMKVLTFAPLPLAWPSFSCFNA